MERFPNRRSKNEEEKKLGKDFRNIKEDILDPYLKAKTEEEKANLRAQYPNLDEIVQIISGLYENKEPKYLKNARKIKDWIEKSGGTKPPSPTSKNGDERKLGKALGTIRQKLLKSYILMDKEGKEEYIKKYPFVEEVFEIVQQIDENKSLKNLRDIKEIQEWIKRTGEKKIPSKHSNDDVEKRLGEKLVRIRKNIIKTYLSLETEDEKKKFKEKYPEIEEVININDEIVKSTCSPYMRKALKIQEWIEQNGEIKTPKSDSKAESEKRLGEALERIRKNLLKTYWSKETEEEKKKFREKYPYLDEIFDIILKIEMKYGNKKQKELASLILQDLEKRRKMQEAKELETKYEEQLLLKNLKDKGE